jgi:integrase
MRRGRGEGSVSTKKRADGRWMAVVDHGWVDGKRRRQTVYGRTRKQAVDALQAALKAKSDGLAPAPARLTVGQYLAAEWLPAAKASVRPSTYESYRSIVDRHLVPAFGKTRLTALTVADVERMLRAKSAVGLSPRRCQMIRAVLRIALGRAVRNSLLPRNVATLAAAPRQERHEIEPFAPDEIRTLLAAVRGHRLEAVVVLAVSSGLRMGELLGLSWPDVDLERGSLTVRVALAKIDGAWDLVPPKSSTSRRTISMPELGVVALRAHRTRQLEERLRSGGTWDPSRDGHDEPWNLVFATATGRPLDGPNVLRTFHGILRDAGLPRRRFHDLRHSAATALLVAGVSARVVQSILGHSQISLTLGTYSHAIPELQKDAAERMDALLAAR